jgi:predicted transcriptional regulator of viral defense system
MDMVGEARGERQSKSDRLFEVAEQQAGFFTAGQALRAGYSYRLHHYHRRAGNWILVGHGLYRLRQYPGVEDEDLVRLSLWSRGRDGRPQAVVSHETALRLHELTDLMPDRIHLSVPKGFRKRSPKGVVIHKVLLEDSDLEDRIGYRITNPLRTILDIARSPRVSPEHLAMAVAQALDRGLVRRKRLEEALNTLKDKGGRTVVEGALLEVADNNSGPIEDG